ncbi:cullin-associated NEDD8-dissociated protein 1 [Tanacetum coccineum]
MKSMADKHRSEREFMEGDWNVGQLAYKLELPSNAQVHSVFHVSQLKKCKIVEAAMGSFRHFRDDGLIVVTPIVVVDWRIVKKKNIIDKDVLKEKILLCVYAISSPVLSTAGERYYKVTAEALRVSDFDFKPYIRPLYNAIMSRLTNQDQNQEVKECDISCIGLVVSTFGDHLIANLPACLPVIVDRMGNKVNRLTAVKAFAVIAASPLHIDLSCVLDHVIVELTAFLRKQNLNLDSWLILLFLKIRKPSIMVGNARHLKTLIVNCGDKISSAAYKVIIMELSTLISDSDLHMTALALELCCTLMSDRRYGPTVGLTVRNIVLPHALALVKSSSLQGQALLLLHFKWHSSLFMYLNDTRKILALSRGLVLRGNHSMLLIFVAVGACFDSS